MGTDPLSAPVMCAALVGRAGEQEALRTLVDRTRDGQGQVALVSGEAGVGKSRLVAEAKTYAAAQGFAVLQGTCFQMDSSYPYAPLVDLLRSTSSPGASAGSGTEPISLDFARLLPELGPAGAGEAHGDPEREKRRLFAAFTRFFSGQAARHPLLVVLEDLHWCDDTSLEYLQSLVRLCPMQPLLVLITYRSDEVEPSLQRFLAYLDRTRLSHELRLAPLSHGEVGAMLSSMLSLPESRRQELLERIYPLTEGNPFFVEELLTALVSHGDLQPESQARQHEQAGTGKSPDRPVASSPLSRASTVPSSAPGARRTPIVPLEITLPRTIQDAVRQRMERLSPGAERVVTLAAVAGRRFDFALLQEVMGCDEEELLGWIKELVGAQLVAEESADKFAFRHALTQQAVYTGLLSRERRTLHRALVEGIEKLRAQQEGQAGAPLFEGHLEDLAYHCYEGELWDKALEYAQRAGEKAMTLYAPREAVEHFTRALSALERAQGADEAQPWTLHQRRGQAYEALGEFERALSDYKRALQISRTAHDRRLEWESLSAVGFLWTGRDYKRAGNWFRQALALAEELADPLSRARSVSRLGNWLVNTGQIEEGLQAHEAALRLFEADGTKEGMRGMADTLGQLGMIRHFSGDPVGAVRHFFSRSIELFRSCGDSVNLSVMLAARALDSASEMIESTFSALRTRDECIQDLDEALRLARQINSHSGQAFVEMSTAQVLASFGEYGAAHAHAQEALRIATAIEHQEWIASTHIAFGLLHLLTLEPALAIPYLESALAGAGEAGSALWTGYATPYIALAYAQDGQFARAEEMLGTIIKRDQAPRSFFEREAARVWGELALAQGKPATALRIAEQLIASAPGDGQGQAIPHLWALKGEALLALKRPQEAAPALEKALEGALQRQAPAVLWRIHRSLGKTYRVLKQEEQARAELASAKEVIERLAAGIGEPAWRERFLQAAMSSLPQPRPMPPGALKKMYGGLSARERQVAALVARGSTNREIAAALVTSERTAEAHVSNILAKLGFSTRAQIAAWAVEKGLTTTP